MRWIAKGAIAALGVSAIAVALGGAATAATGKHPATAHRATHTVAGKHLGPASPLPNAPPPKYAVVNACISVFTLVAAALIVSLPLVPSVVILTLLLEPSETIEPSE